jgi:hypothetical protein
MGTVNPLQLAGTVTLVQSVVHVSTLALGLALSACGSGDPCNGRFQVHAGSVEVTGLDGGDRLEELECVEVITGDLSISDTQVKSLEPLGSLVHVLGDVSIAYRVGSSMRLESLHGLEQLTEVGGELELSSLPRLESLEPLGALVRVGGRLRLHGLSRLDSFDGLGALESIGGDLDITVNEKLLDLKALRSLEAVGGTLSIASNPRLTSADFGRSPSVRGMEVRSNESLTRVEGVQVLPGRSEPCRSERVLGSETPPDQDILIVFNDALERVVLQPAENVCIDVWSNARLTELVAAGEGSGSLQLLDLPHLTKLNLNRWRFESLEISHTGLETLDGLRNATVDCVLEVSYNPELQEVSDLGSMTRVAGHFSVYENPKLPTCQVQAIVDELPEADRQCIAYGMTQGPRYVAVGDNDDDAVCE